MIQSKRIPNSRIQIHLGDITRLEVDAIVNAANESLLGGGGVDDAIHRAAGPRLREACRRLQGCDIGEAKVTRGYQLPADHVIHTVGPRYRDGDCGESEQLRASYRHSLLLAKKHGIESIAFPAVSCGAFGYPLQEAVAIAADEVEQFLAEEENDRFQRVVFCMIDPALFELYKKVLPQAVVI